MNWKTGESRRTVAIGLLALVIVAGLFIASGWSLPSFGTGSTAGGASPTPVTQPTFGPSASIEGRVTVHIKKLGGTARRFSYTIKNSGNVPIAGLQINGATANLYAISTRRLWNFFGSGVCHRGPAGILIYWSTGLNSPTVIKPGAQLTLSFDTRTRGTTEDGYSLSWANAAPQFGRVLGPKGSSLPVHQTCAK
jgi:hypothetical protein